MADKEQMLAEVVSEMLSTSNGDPETVADVIKYAGREVAMAISDLAEAIREVARSIADRA